MVWCLLRYYLHLPTLQDPRSHLGRKRLSVRCINFFLIKLAIFHALELRHLQRVGEAWAKLDSPNLELHKNGVAFREIERQTGVSHNTVIYWVKEKYK